MTYAVYYDDIMDFETDMQSDNAKFRLQEPEKVQRRLSSSETDQSSKHKRLDRVRRVSIGIYYATTDKLEAGVSKAKKGLFRASQSVTDKAQNISQSNRVPRAFRGKRSTPRDDLHQNIITSMDGEDPDGYEKGQLIPDPTTTNQEFG